MEEDGGGRRTELRRREDGAEEKELGIRRKEEEWKDGGGRSWRWGRRGKRTESSLEKGGDGERGKFKRKHRKRG